MFALLNIGLVFLSICKSVARDNAVDDQSDVADGNTAVTVHISSRVDIFPTIDDFVNKANHVANADLPVTIHITTYSRHFHNLAEIRIPLVRSLIKRNRTCRHMKHPSRIFFWVFIENFIPH